MSPGSAPADRVRILVATDNHVGYGERLRDRQNDSWRTFEEIISIAREQDVDMVLLAGDLFHDNKPSRKSMVNVMRILRSNCLGDKPCELEMLSDQSDTIAGVFNHVNYEDQDINVSLPVFSIHGNHDDPAGEGGDNYAALDILSASGLVNYYGKALEGDQIKIKPVLLQKGLTKLALYGMGNVRDERLFRLFRDHKVKFFKPTTQQDEWFNIMSVHQNHVAHSEKNYLPESVLPAFMDLVIWGHEHECKIQPNYNHEMGFHVMQPGSSIATSLMPGEAVPKHVAILSVIGKEFEVQPIRLKTVRPFVIRELVLMDDPEVKKLIKKANHRKLIAERLDSVVEEMIAQAKAEWASMHGPEVSEFPKPLIRLRVDSSPPNNEPFDLENSQRFSNKYFDKVANNDILQVHQRKKRTGLNKTNSAMPDLTSLDQLANETIRVDKLVKEFLDKQTLTILPQNSFGDAVTQYVDKDDKHAMEMFVSESLKSQVKLLVARDDEQGDDDEANIAEEMARNKSKLEEQFAKGFLKNRKRSKVKPRPENWNSDLDGEWEAQPGAIIFSDGDQESEPGKAVEKAQAKSTFRGAERTPTKKKPAKGSTEKTKASGAKQSQGKASKKTTPAKTTSESDAMVLDDDDDQESVGSYDQDSLFVKQSPRIRTSRATGNQGRPRRNVGKDSTKSATNARTQQSRISSWARTNSNGQGPGDVEEISSGDSDGFEPVATTVRRRK